MKCWYCIEPKKCSCASAAMRDLRFGVLTQTREFPGVSEISFFKKPHKWTEELRIGQRKGYLRDHCGTKTFTIEIFARKKLKQSMLGYTKGWLVQSVGQSWIGSLVGEFLFRKSPATCGILPKKWFQKHPESEQFLDFVIKHEYNARNTHTTYAWAW